MLFVASMRHQTPFVCFAAWTFAVAAMAGCGDPAGPALSGSISVAPGIRATDFKTLQIRVYADPGTAFDPHSLPASAESESEPSSVSFPYAYKLGDPLGTTNNASRRVVAWLSHADLSEEAVLPQAGDVLCTATAAIKSCGTYGGYCGETSGVDCTLTSPVP